MWLGGYFKFRSHYYINCKIHRSEFEKLADHLFQKVEGILCKLFELCSDVKVGFDISFKVLLWNVGSLIFSWMIFRKLSSLVDVAESLE